MNSESFSPQTLSALLAALVARHGDETALIAGNEAISFATLESNTRSLAGGLAALGIARGDRVAIWLPSVPAWVELEFALARLGAIAVAINTQYRKHEVEDIVERSGARLLVLQPKLGKTDYLSLAEQFDDTRIASLKAFVLVNEGVATHCVKGRCTLDYRSLMIHAEYKADDGHPDYPCNTFTSSGTTSSPKLTLYNQAAVVSHSLAVAQAFPFHEPSAVVLDMLPFCGVFGFSMVMGALAAARPTVLLPVYDAAEAVALIEQHKVTHTAGSDEMFRRIFAAAAPTSRIASLKEGAFANFGGDAVALVAQAVELDIKLFQTYGSSEVQALMTYTAPEAGPQRWALGGGMPCSPKVQVRVRDPNTGQLLPDGESGEIEISGPNVMAGYINNPVAERSTFTSDGYVRTGDLGYMENSRSFVYLARLGDTLRLGGFLVNPREIEAYLESHDGIALAQVVAVDTDQGPRPMAFVMLDSGARLDEAAVIRDCLATMAKFKVPVRVVALERFPTTSSANGEKIQKAKLREMARPLIEA